MKIFTNLFFIFPFLWLSFCHKKEEGGPTTAATTATQTTASVCDTSKNPNCSSPTKKVTPEKKDTPTTAGGDNGLQGLLSSLGGGSGGAGGGGDQAATDQALHTFQWVKRFGGPYFTTKLNDPKEKVLPATDSAAVRPFHCPGDSFYVGEQSTYDEEDRVFKAACIFFEDGTERPVKKGECKIYEPANKAQRPVEFKCPKDTFLAGQLSTFEEAEKDRIYQFECCQMQNWDGKTISILKAQTESGQSVDYCQEVRRQGYTAKPNLDVNLPKDPVNFTCDDGEVLTSITSEYRGWSEDNEGDRRYSFKCCKVGIN